MTRNECLIPVEIVSALLRLDADAGKLYWKPRGVEQFSSGIQTAVAAMNSWNAKYAGEMAFTSIRSNRYFCGAIKNKTFHAHRVVFALHHGAWPEFTIDHIDGDGFNNRPCNLRDVTHRENMRNQKLRSTNKTGFVGVSFVKNCAKYEARIHVGDAPLVIGYFDSAESAAKARAPYGKSNGYHINHGRKAS